MSSLSIIEWNAKHPSHWEWENLVGSSSTATENNKSWQPAEWGIEAEEGVDSGSLYSYGGGSASGGSSGGASFDPVHACMSKGSKSASLNSSSTEEMKLPKFSVEASKGYAENFSCKRDVTTAKLCGASPALETSLCSGEPFLSLNIGKRTYLEDVSDGRNSKASNFPSFVKSSDASVKRIKSNIQSMPAPSCQVEGCNIDLSSAKDYHRKHKVCASHSKSPKVVVNGVERRFCQQCSRFHGLSEFDENKRSCRKRLSDHNARRRKPHPDVSHFNQARLSTIIYGGLQEMNSMYSGVPRGNTKSSVNLTWSNTSALKFTQTKGDAPYRGKDGSVCADPHVFHGNKLPNNMRPVTAMSDGSYEQITVKDTTVKIFGGGSEGSLISAGSLDAPRNLHRALSLLSTDSHDSYKQSTVVLHDMNNTSIPRPWNYVVPQTLSLPSLTEYWNMEQCPSNSQRHDLTPQSGISGTVLGGSNLPECLVPSEGQNEYGFEPVHLA